MSDLIGIFVYGTLRPGSYNHWYEEEGVDPNCTARGRLYFVHGHSGFPVADFDEEGVIVGDVIWLRDDSQDFQDICNMELGAGYTLRDIEVTDAEGSTYTAYAWHYPQKLRGKRIPDGDWLKATASHVP